MVRGVTKGVIRIGYGGSGSEAKIFIELRTVFPGIGGTIITQQAVPVALREEFNKVPKSAHRIFLKHALIKKLEDYFQRKGVYRFPHIPRPLGSISKTKRKPYEAYLYQWAFGSDGFPWEYMNIQKGSAMVRLDDWVEFGTAFKEAGINLTSDCTDSDDGRISQNIVHQFHNVRWDLENPELNPLWKRIDFGSASIRINYGKLRGFLADKEKDMRRILRSERYDMMVLSLEYLTNFEKMDRLDIGRLDSLVGSYRISSLRHYISRGRGISEGLIAHISLRTESLV